jgi:hypothetical protein
LCKWPSPTSTFIGTTTRVTVVLDQRHAGGKRVSKQAAHIQQFFGHGIHVVPRAPIQWRSACLEDRRRGQTLHWYLVTEWRGSSAICLNICNMSQYVYDADHEKQLEARLSQVNSYMRDAASIQPCAHQHDPYWCAQCDGIGSRILRNWQRMLHDVNPHIHSFIYAAQRAKELCANAGHSLEDVVLRINAETCHSQHHKGTMNNPQVARSRCLCRPVDLYLWTMGETLLFPS